MTDFQPYQTPQSCALVIFGVTGDLAHRLVIPSLYNLAEVKLLPEQFCIVGVARRDMSNDALRGSLMKGLHEFATRPVDDKIANRLLECVTYAEADPSDPASFDRLKERLEQLEAARNTGGTKPPGRQCSLSSMPGKKRVPRGWNSILPAARALQVRANC